MKVELSLCATSKDGMQTNDPPDFEFVSAELDYLSGSRGRNYVHVS